MSKIFWKKEKVDDPKVYFNVVIDFVDKRPDDENLRRELINSYAKLLKPTKDFFNARIKKWNEEYPYDMTPDPITNVDPRYEKYINGRFKPFLDILNENSEPIELYLDKCNEIYGVYRKDNSIELFHYVDYDHPMNWDGTEYVMKKEEK